MKVVKRCEASLSNRVFITVRNAVRYDNSVFGARFTFHNHQFSKAILNILSWRCKMSFRIANHICK